MATQVSSPAVSLPLRPIVLPYLYLGAAICGTGLLWASGLALHLKITAVSVLFFGLGVAFVQHRRTHQGVLRLGVAGWQHVWHQGGSLYEQPLTPVAAYVWFQRLVIVCFRVAGRPGSRRVFWVWQTQAIVDEHRSLKVLIYTGRFLGS